MSMLLEEEIRTRGIAEFDVRDETMDRTRTTRTPTRTTRIPTTRTPTTRIRATPTPTQKTRASALARTLDPVSGEEFLAEHWEQTPLVVPRGEQGRFDDLLSVADVERLLTSGGLRFPGFRLAKAGAKLEVADYTKDLSWRPQPFSGTADVERVLAEFEDGATIVLQGLHLNWQPLAEFCRSLEAELGHSGAGQRLLHAAGGAGPPCPPRHARRLLAPGRGREALARLRARLGAAAQAPALQGRDDGRAG